MRTLFRLKGALRITVVQQVHTGIPRVSWRLWSPYTHSGLVVLNKKWKQLSRWQEMWKEKEDIEVSDEVSDESLHIKEGLTGFEGEVQCRNLVKRCLFLDYMLSTPWYICIDVGKRGKNIKNRCHLHLKMTLQFILFPKQWSFFWWAQQVFSLQQ